MIKVLIVEDQIMLRDSLGKILGQEPGLEVVGMTGSAAMAPDLCRECRPDLVLMDVVTGDSGNGIAAAARIRRELPEIKIVIMTALPEITFVDAARKAGAQSFVYKNAGFDHLMTVIRSTMNGQGIYPAGTEGRPFQADFTDTEIALMRLVCQGKTRAEMAAALGVSEGTVKARITAILDKTGFDSIAKFAVYAVANGYIFPEL